MKIKIRIKNKRPFVQFLFGSFVSSFPFLEVRTLITAMRAAVIEHLYSADEPKCFTHIDSLNLQFNPAKEQRQLVLAAEKNSKPRMSGFGVQT